MQLRNYQQQALDTLWEWVARNPGNPALVLPTGAGKSPLMAAIARQACEQWGARVGIVAHVQELIEQNFDKLRRLWPEADAGIYAAGLRRRDRFNRVLFLQIQSVAKRAHELGAFDLLLIDEAHRIPLKSEGLYRQFIADLRRFNPDMRVVGLTATPYRLQGAAVPVCGPEHVLNEVAFEARIPDLIADGYLSRLVSRAGELPSLEGVHTRGGEYVEAELAERMDDAGLIARTCDDLVARAASRRAWIVFCVNVSHAEHVRDALAARGIAAGLVHGGTPKGERAALVEAFQRGDLRAMVNVNVLSEGFDAPHIDCVAMLRPTKSPGLYYQQVGRGLRLADGKADCLVLDYAGNVLEHGPVDEIRVVRKPRSEAAVVQTTRTKECPQCEAHLPLGARVCQHCGFVFTSGAPEHLDRPVDAPILASERVRDVREFDVSSIQYSRHAKPGKPVSLRVTYQCGLRHFHEWVCLEHSGYARTKALTWWAARTKETPPRTVDEALAVAYGLPTPARITVDLTDKFPSVLSHEFGESAVRETRPIPDNAPAWLAGTRRAA